MIIVNFIGNEVEKYIRGLDQYDRGQILCISGLDLPKFVEVQFSLQETGGLAERIVGITTDGVTEVEIPNYMLTNNDATSDYEIYAFVYVTNETSAETVYKITMEVNSRPKPNPYDTPEDIGMFNRVIEVMKDSVVAAENAAGTSEKNAQKTGEDRKAIEEMVGTITGIEQQVQDVKAYAGQARSASENALLSEQESKKSEGAALQHRTGAETAENNAELAESNAKKSEQAVEQAKQLVMQMGQEVLQNKNQVDGKVEAFNKVVTDASDAIGTAKTDAVNTIGTKGTEQTKKVSDEGAKQVKAVEDKGNEVLQSIPEDFTAQMESKLDKQQGVENAGKILEIGIDGMVVPVEKPSGGTGSGTTQNGTLYYSEEEIELNPWGNGGCVLSGDGKKLTVKTYIEGGKSVYFLSNQNGTIAESFPISAACYDENGEKISNDIYAFKNPVKIPDKTKYITQDIKVGSVQDGVSLFYGLPMIITENKDETNVYAIAEKKTIKHGKNEIANAVSKSVKLPESTYETLTNYYDGSREVKIKVKTGDVIRSNLFNINISGLISEDDKWNDRDSSTGVKFNFEVTGDAPKEVSYTVPRYYKYVIVKYNPTYPNIGQSKWYDIKNPYITLNKEVVGTITQGDTVLLEPKVETVLNKKIEDGVKKGLEQADVTSPLNNKKWMVFGDSTSCYAGIENSYPAFVANRTGCIVTNKALAGSRITANETDGNPIVNIVINNLTPDVEILTLVGGYNDRRSYNQSSPNWDWLGTMLLDNNNPNLDIKTFYGALNTIAKKWYEVCPSATKAFFTIFPCGINPNGEYETKINGIIKEVANYWCIPCFDAWNEVGLPCRLDYINQTYYMGDRIHPNKAGGEFISKYIQAKLESIM